MHTIDTLEFGHEPKDTVPPVAASSIHALNDFNSRLSRNPYEFKSASEHTVGQISLDTQVYYENVDGDKNVHTENIMEEPDGRNPNPAILSSPDGVQTLLVNTNQAVIGNVGSKDAIGTVALESCTAFGFTLQPKLTDDRKPGNIKVLFSHTATNPKARFRDLVSLVSDKYQITAIAASVPNELAAGLSEEVAQMATELPSKPKVMLHHRVGNGAMIITNQEATFLNRTPTKNGEFKYTPILIEKWQK